MEETMHVVFEALRSYRGASLYFTLYVLSAAYLFFTEEERAKRILLLYMPLGVFVVFVFPPTAHIVMHTIMDTEIYYRQLWLLPCAATVSYALCRAVMKAKRTSGKLLLTLAGIAVIIFGGKNVYAQGNYTRAENPQHLPQAAIDVCDAILDDDLEYIVTAAFPLSLVEYTRQYTAEIVSPYGREMIIDKWNGHHDLYDAIEAPLLNAEELTTLARAYGTECIVVHSIKGMEGRMEDYHFYKIATVSGYDIYMEEWLAERHPGFEAPSEEGED